MFFSKLYAPTLKESPSDADLIGIKYLIRAGFVRKIAAGIYTYLPLGWKVIKKIESIVREEMDAIGSQEIMLPIIQPAELWHESGRWEDYGPEMMKLKDRHDRDFTLGPTHEEMITAVVRNELKSYKQLPLSLYQIQNKYRDEIRPRFGLMRSREFIMKDAYSFDRDEEGLNRSYEDMYAAYEKIFDRCGLKYRAVDADTGAMGGSNSHEFTALSDVGESQIAYCENCHMAATVERAETPDAKHDDEEMKPLEEVGTPDMKTIEDVAAYLGLKKDQTIKALLFVTYDNDEKESGYVAAFIRGDRELNMVKLVNALGIPEHSIDFADEGKMGPATGCVGGFTGPVGLHDLTIVVDSELPGQKNLCAGACKKDAHLKNVNYGRDYEADIVADIKLIRENDPCPSCGEPVKIARGIEVGQVFKLGTKYSESMGAYYKDENQKSRPIVMGCYGIGVTRTLAAIVEQHHDDDGILWPLSVAPYQVIIIIVKTSDETQMKEGEKLYSELKKAGADVLLDDRDERPGVKFKDADLIGIPVQITVGRGAAEGKAEYKLRCGSKKEELTFDEAIKRTVGMINGE